MERGSLALSTPFAPTSMGSTRMRAFAKGASFGAPPALHMGELRIRTGSKTVPVPADITQMSERKVTLSTDARVKIGEVIQLVAIMGGREVRVLTQVAGTAQELVGRRICVHADILAIARQDRAQMASHVGHTPRSESARVQYLRRALAGGAR